MIPTQLRPQPRNLASPPVYRDSPNTLHTTTPSKPQHLTPDPRKSRSEKLILPDIKSSRGSSSGTSSHFRKTKPKSSGSRCGAVHGYAVQAYSGLSMRRNLTRVSILLNPPKPAHFDQANWPRSSYFGLFDGNSGKKCAEYLQSNLFSNITSMNEFPSQIKLAFFNGFIETDSNYLKLAEEAGDMSGSTAIVCFVIGNKCILACCGDSKAIMSLDKGRKIKTLFKPHVPSNVAEKNRIVKAGGSVSADYYLNEEGQAVPTGLLRVSPGKLRVTRAFGNIDAKLQKFAGNPKVCIAEPDVTHFSIDDSCDFLLIATSSLFQYFEYKEVVSIVWETISLSIQNDLHSQLSSAVENLISKAEKKGANTSITCLLIAFKSMQLNTHEENK